MGYIGPAVEMEWHEELASQSLTPDGILTSFTMDRSVATDAGVAVFYENLRQEPGVAYTVSGTTINFTFTPASGKNLYLVFFASQTAQTTPAAGTVVEASLDSTVATPILLATVTASASATVDFDSGIDFTAYDVYQVIFDDMVPATDATQLHMQFSDDGGATYEATAYKWGIHGQQGGTINNVNNTSDTKIVLTNGTAVDIGNASGEGANGVLYFYNMASTTRYTAVNGLIQWNGDNAALVYNVVTGRRDTLAAYDGIRFSQSSGNITSGTFKLYGLR